MRIVKKVQQEYFEAVLADKKRFEVRLADRELTGRQIECEVLYKFNTKEMERFHSKEEIEKYGLVILAIRQHR